jgi:hypothetical protein
MSGVPDEDVVSKQDRSELADVGGSRLVPEEDRAWLENEMARMLVGCRREDW